MSLLVLAYSLLQDEAALVMVFQVAYSLNVVKSSDRCTDHKPAESFQRSSTDNTHVEEMRCLGPAHGVDGEKTPYSDVLKLVETIDVGCKFNLILSLSVFIQLNR